MSFCGDHEKNPKDGSVEYLESEGLLLNSPLNCFRVVWTWVVTLLFLCALIFSWDMGIIIKCLSHMEFSEIILVKNLALSMEHSKIFFFLILFILFIYFWLCWVLVAVRGLSLVAASGGCSSLRCVGLQWLLLLRSTGSRRTGFSSCGSWTLECRLSSFGARA